MLTHRLAVRPRELRTKGADAFVELLDLRFAENSTWRLVLETVNESSEEIDVLSFDGGEFEAGIRFIAPRCRRASI